jgi:hypothetical protein
MLKIFLVLMVLIPGQPEPFVERTEIPTVAECIGKAAELTNRIAAVDGTFIAGATCVIEKSGDKT